MEQNHEADERQAEQLADDRVETWRCLIILCMQRMMRQVVTAEQVLMKSEHH